MDGAPIAAAVRDFFDPAEAEAVKVAAEVPVIAEREVPTPDPGTDEAESDNTRSNAFKQSIDFVAIHPPSRKFVGIEAQAIDLRGGGVGPAWRALLEGTPERWREFFTDEARAKQRKDTVAYGVNTANIFKRLGLQVALKGALMQKLGTRLYVVTQRRPFDYLTRRADIPWLVDGEPWEITFLTFDYTGDALANGQLAFEPAGTFRTTVEDYASGLVTPAATITAEDFLERVERKISGGFAASLKDWA